LSTDRPTAESLYRAGGALDRTTSFAYNGLVVSQTDPLSHTTTRATNAWGGLVRVTDAANGQTNLQYDAFDLLKQATDPANNVVSQVSYNVRGMRTQLADMDLGTWNYTPNALGEVVSQTDAKSQATTFVYDLLGRPATRTESEGTSTWTWGTLADNTASNKYVGRLKSLTGPGYAESFTYDAKSRPLTRTITTDASYPFDYAYNTLGQLDTLTYPTSTAGVRFKTKYGYSGGYLSSVQDYTGNVNGPILWNLNLLDARLNATSETYGNGLWLQNGFDVLTGVPLTRQSGTGGQSSNVQNLSYVWDTAGNLSNRQDLRQSLTETFSYDALDRLTLASGPAAQSTSIGYDAIGNLTSKTGVGTYTYHATRKHAVVTAGGASYGYDGNGNLTSRSGATVSWSSYNLPTYIADPNGYSAQFWYAPDRSRWKQVSSYSGGTETTLYVGGLLEKLTTATRTHWKHLIATPSGQVQVIRRSDGTTDTFYVTTDHLGSTDAVLNTAGTVLMRGSFGVHGARRASNWQGAPTTTEWQAIADTTRRGYTGHEQIDNVLVVHMSGRVFDPAIGRFLSADPYVDCMRSTQGWNRYAYVKGRLLSRYDPSGFALEEIIVNGKRIPEEPVDTVSNGRPFAEPSFDGAPGLVGGGGPSPKNNGKQQDCATTCQKIAAASVGLASAFAGGVAGFQGAGAPGALVGAALAGLAGATVGYAGSSNNALHAGVLAASSDMTGPKNVGTIGGAITGGVIGNQLTNSVISAGMPNTLAVPTGSSVGAAFGGYIQGYFSVTAGASWGAAFARAATTARSAGAIGLAAGAIQVAVSQWLQAQTGCNCSK
jgi:RHS repeat-associated protein